MAKVEGGRYRPMGWLIIRDDAALADWSGLRFMTELELVKACRGPLEAVPGEYSWGNAECVLSSNRVNRGMDDEMDATGNCLLSGEESLRVGSFARSNSTRVSAGATYWGMLDFGGNLYERFVNLSTPKGRAYTGEHGDGELTAQGFANVQKWPCSAADGGNVNDASGTGLFGGSYKTMANSSLSRLHVASRGLAETIYEYRCADYGFRAVRTSPLCAATAE